MSSSSFVILWSAMRISVLVSQACGSTPLSFAVSIRVVGTSARYPTKTLAENRIFKKGGFPGRLQIECDLPVFTDSLWRLGFRADQRGADWILALPETPLSSDSHYRRLRHITR